VRDQKELLRLIRTFAEGIAVADLKDAYPTVMEDLQVLLTYKLFTCDDVLHICNSFVMTCIYLLLESMTGKHFEHWRSDGIVSMDYIHICMFLLGAKRNIRTCCMTFFGANRALTMCFVWSDFHTQNEYLMVTSKRCLVIEIVFMVFLSDSQKVMGWRRISQ